MGTGATNITKATETVWREFSMEHHGALYSNRKPQGTDFKDDLFKNVREKHVQMIIDAASDEQLSAQQMEDRKACICIYVHVSMLTPSFASTNVKSHESVCEGHLCSHMGRLRRSWTAPSARLRLPISSSSHS